MQGTTLSKFERGCIEHAATLVIMERAAKPDFKVSELVTRENRTDLSDAKFEELVSYRIQEKELNPEYYMLINDFTAIQRFIFEDDTIYEFTLKNGKSFKLSSLDLINKSKFDAMFMTCTSRVPIGKKTDYCVFLSHVLVAKEVKQTEIVKEADEVTEVKEAIFRFIEGATIVGHPDDTQFSTDSVYEQNGGIYVPSTTIKRIIKRDDKNFTMRHLRVILDQYLKSSSVVVRLKDKSCRFWVFDMAKINMPLKMKKVNMDKEGENA